jgi:Fe-coproporphyrin III synthase
MRHGIVFASVFVTYRCNARCAMCYRWKRPSRIEEEFEPKILEKLPKGIKSINIAGGEPFLRDDLDKILSILFTKTNRIVFSTNGVLTDRIIDIARKYPQIGIRISIEGLPAINDQIRGIVNGFDKALRTLLTLKAMKINDIGVAITISDKNLHSLMDVYRLMHFLGMEFSTCITHNSFFFNKFDNVLIDKEAISREFERLSREQLKSFHPKDWFRAYFNHGLANYALGQKRLLPCMAGTDSFRITPCGKVVACECTMEENIMGDLTKDAFNDIWKSKQAEEARALQHKCNRQCWSIGTVSIAIKKELHKPIFWILKNKLRKVSPLLPINA